MASFLRPRRGKKATATSTLTGTAALKRGEVFFEVPTGGVGTGKGAIKMGDGSTDYASLPYFLSMDDSPVAFTNSTAAETTINNTALLTAMAPTASLATVLTKVKQLLHNYNSQITQLNNDLSNIGIIYSFGCKPGSIEVTNESRTTGTTLDSKLLPAGTYILVGRASTGDANRIFLVGFSTVSGYIESDSKSTGVGATSVFIKTFTQDTTVYFVVGTLGTSVYTYNDTNYFGGSAIRIK